MIARLLELPREPFRPLDAIVVLGARLGPGDRLTRVLAERVAAAAELHARGGGRIVVATGGVTGGTRAEADAIAEALHARGVADVIVERASRTTRENAALTAPLLAVRGARSAWIVTQPFHARRATRLFRAAGIDAHAWHLDGGRVKRSWILREYAAWAKLLLGR